MHKLHKIILYLTIILTINLLNAGILEEKIKKIAEEGGKAMSLSSIIKFNRNSLAF